MDKLEMQTPNFTDENIEKLAELFPNCVTESRNDKGMVKKAIDFDLLKQELSENIVDGPRERYQINWPGKKEALVTANTPINKTLRPCREESVDFDTTENLYIEGDNLEALKLLQESYLGKIKMIYIDPPYNTGKDFVYSDNFTGDKEDELLRSGQKDLDGGQLVQNLEANGRFHSDWVSMMYGRLKLAKNLLSDDGMIFISIDDWENHNLKKMCDEIFGEKNFINQRQFIWHIPNGTNKGFIARAHEYILGYAKNINDLKPFKRDSSQASLSTERCTNAPTTGNPTSEILFPKGMRYDGKDATFEGIIGDNEPIEIIGKMIFENGFLKNDIVLKSSWRNKRQVLNFIREGYALDEKGQKVIDVFFDSIGKPKYTKELIYFSPKSVQKFKSTTDVKMPFDNPKPVELVKFLCSLVAEEGDIILDFFAGSATTGQSVIELNLNKKLHFILVQLAEQISSTNPDQKLARQLCDELNVPQTISEISKERIRRAGRKIKEANTDKAGIEDLDIGFRVLKIDSSNMKDVYYTPDSMSQSLLDSQEQNIKEDRTAEDLLFQVLLDWGVDLTLPITREEIQGKTVYFVDEDTLVACFEDNLDADFAKKIAKRKPLRAIFKESGYKQDEDKINIDQVILQFSPDTEVRAI